MTQPMHKAVQIAVTSAQAVSSKLLQAQQVQMQTHWLLRLDRLLQAVGRAGVSSQADWHTVPRDLRSLEQI